MGGVRAFATRQALALALTALPAAAFALAPIPASTAARLASLDCTHIGAAEVAQVLAATPAPRIIALHGSVPIVTMAPLAAFFEAMGYPRDRLVNPADGSRTYSSRIESRRLAGNLAWHYEREGLMPVLIGHSQGGMIVIKVLHDLAGTRDSSPIPVWNPAQAEPEARTTVTDPLTGSQRDVRELKVDLAAAMATGSLPRLLLGQWGILPLLRDVPDSVAAFLGFGIPFDPIAGTLAEPPKFHATGSARVRNVVLPATYSHIDLPRVDHLAAQVQVRAWIDAYQPGEERPLPPGDVTNIVHAAELWHAVKRQWCEGAKRVAATGTR